MAEHYNKRIQNIIQKELFKANSSIKIAVAWDFVFPAMALTEQARHCSSDVGKTFIVLSSIPSGASVMRRLLYKSPTARLKTFLLTWNSLYIASASDLSVKGQ